jgi:TPR repeat protein
MRRFLALPCAAVALVVLAGCGGGEPGERSRNEGGVEITGIDGRVTVVRPGRDPNAAYAEGLDFKNQGNCPAAVLRLRRVASIGPGYENAQTALGACLLDIGAKTNPPAPEYDEGLTWLKRAADAGWPEAQATLAQAYAFGPVNVRSGEEAGYWLALYQANPSKARIGFAPMIAGDIAAIEKTLSAEERALGAKRAITWERKVWIPPPRAAGEDEDIGPSDRTRAGRRIRR